MSTKFHTANDAIIERLRLVFPENIFQIALIPAAIKKTDMDRLVARKPFIGIAWTGYKPDASRTLSGVASWTVLLGCDNASGVDARLKGDTKGIGLFGMITAAAGVLHGWTIADIGAVSVTAVDPADTDAWADSRLAIAAIDIALPFTLDAVSPDDPADFLSLGLTWLLPPPADPGPSGVLTVRTP